MLKKELGLVVYWSLIDKGGYLLRHGARPICGTETKTMPKEVIADKTDNLWICGRVSIPVTNARTTVHIAWKNCRTRKDHNDASFVQSMERRLQHHDEPKASSQILFPVVSILHPL